MVVRVREIERCLERRSCEIPSPIPAVRQMHINPGNCSGIPIVLWLSLWVPAFAGTTDGGPFIHQYKNISPLAVGEVVKERIFRARCSTIDRGPMLQTWVPVDEQLLGKK